MPSVYAGGIVWQLTPGFTINGHFLLQEDVLDPVGKRFEAMQAEATDGNQTEQLRLALQVEWDDEERHHGGHPPHTWYFDFRREDFVYQVGGFAGFPPAAG